MLSEIHSTNNNGHARSALNLDFPGAGCSYRDINDCLDIFRDQDGNAVVNVDKISEASAICNNERFRQHNSGLEDPRLYCLSEATLTRLYHILSHDILDGSRIVNLIAENLGYEYQLFSNGKELRSISRELTENRGAFFKFVQERIKEFESGEKVYIRGKHIHSPGFMRSLERSQVLVPNLKNIIRQLQESNDKRDRGTLIDIGAWDGSISSRLVPFFNRIDAIEPDDVRFSQLLGTQRRLAQTHSGRETGQSPIQFDFNPVHNDLMQLVTDGKYRGSQSDVILMSHVLYFLKFEEDEKALAWAMDCLRPGGALIIVLNDMQHMPGSRAHMRSLIQDRENNLMPERYVRLLSEHGAGIQVYRPTLRLEARTEGGLEVINDITRYLLAGESRNRVGALENYFNKYIKERSGRGIHTFDHVINIIVARKGYTGVQRVYNPMIEAGDSANKIHIKANDYIRNTEIAENPVLESFFSGDAWDSQKFIHTPKSEIYITLYRRLAMPVFTAQELFCSAGEIEELKQRMKSVIRNWIDNPEFSDSKSVDDLQNLLSEVMNRKSKPGEVTERESEKPSTPPLNKLPFDIEPRDFDTDGKFYYKKLMQKRSEILPGDGDCIRYSGRVFSQDVDAYAAEIKKIPVLTIEEEQQLTREIVEFRNKLQKALLQSPYVLDCIYDHFYNFIHLKIGYPNRMFQVAHGESGTDVRKRLEKNLPLITVELCNLQRAIAAGYDSEDPINRQKYKRSIANLIDLISKTPISDELMEEIAKKYENHIRACFSRFEASHHSGKGSKPDLNARMRIELLSLELVNGEDLNACAEHLKNIKILFYHFSQAKWEMAARNLRLAFSIALKKFNRCSLSGDELIQEATGGLMRAVVKYEPDLGYKFSTYASYWIRQAIGRGIANKSNTVSLPVGVRTNMSKVDKALRKDESLRRNIKGLANETGLSENVVKNTLKVLEQQTNRLDFTYQDGDGDTLLSGLADTRTQEEMSPENNELREVIRLALRSLTPREVNLLSQRFGLGIKAEQFDNPDSHGVRLVDMMSDYGVDRTLEEVGFTESRTRERVRQLESRAINKLRSIVSPASEKLALMARDDYGAELSEEMQARLGRKSGKNYEDERLNYTLTELGLDVRTANSIEKYLEISKVGELLECTREQLLVVPMVGEKTLKTVYDCLENIGFKISD